MALQKNIKEVESTEAGFVANAAPKNDGFLTDVTGYPMIKMRGNDYDFWFPEKSRDELGTYTYYDKTVKDMTALNDCIVQRRLSSYGDADTYFDFSTDDQAVLNVGGVPFLTVAESESAAIGTLGGNLALGENYLNYDGTADKGIVFTSSQQLVIKNTDGIALGDAKQMVSIREDTGNGNTGNGAGISLHGNDGVSATRLFGGIKAYKENSTTGNYDASVYIQTRANSSYPANALRLDSDQNGYIKNKLMVGSLDETPTVNLAVYEDGYNACLLSVGDAFSGPNAGLVIGVDTVVRTNGTPLNSQCVIRADGYGRSIYVQGETATPNVFDTFIACEKLDAYGDYKTVTIADKLVVDGNLYIDNLPAKSDPATTVLVPGPDGCVSTRTADQIRSDIGAVAGNDPRLSDARVPINADYYVQGSSSARTTNAGATDLNSYSQSGFYRATSTAPNLPTVDSYGIIHTNDTNNPHAFQLASRWYGNQLFYRRKQNDTWQPWVELYHSGNLNPVDYVTLSTAQTITGQKTFSANTTINGKLVVDGDAQIDGYLQVGNLLAGPIFANAYYDGATLKIKNPGHAGMVNFDSGSGSWQFYKSNNSGSAGDTITGWILIDTIA